MSRIKNAMAISLVLLSLAATPATASDDRDHQFLPPPPPPPHHHAVSAPELDPAQGMAALALLAGTIAILRGRRRKK